MKLKIYTMFYFPFVMGGNVWQSRACEVEVDELHELGGGYQGYLVTSPNGHYVVAEATTGAMVGPNLEEVRKDIAEADPDVMAKQMAQAKSDSTGVQELEPEKFWHEWEKSMGLSQAETITDTMLDETDTL
jgi:hypothetical protein